MIKLNDYLEFFPVPDNVTAMKIACKEIVNVLEDGVPYQWKLEFKKEEFDSSSSTLKEYLDICVRLEETELQKPLKKKIACMIKKHNNSDRKKPKSRHKRHHGLGKCHQSKHHGGNAGRNIVITMFFVTMTLTSATLFKLVGNTFSPRTVLQNSRGSNRSGSLKTPKGAQKYAA
eukprot:7710872-Ditylum_brightwellii.AAC.1